MGRSCTPTLKSWWDTSRGARWVPDGNGKNLTWALAALVIACIGNHCPV
jgi:hypothetical protein